MTTATKFDLKEARRLVEVLAREVRRLNDELHVATRDVQAGITALDPVGAVDSRLLDQSVIDLISAVNGLRGTTARTAVAVLL